MTELLRRVDVWNRRKSQGKRLQCHAAALFRIPSSEHVTTTTCHGSCHRTVSGYNQSKTTIKIPCPSECAISIASPQRSWPFSPPVHLPTQLVSPPPQSSLPARPIPSRLLTISYVQHRPHSANAPAAPTAPSSRSTALYPSILPAQYPTILSSFRD